MCTKTLAPMIRNVHRSGAVLVVRRLHADHGGRRPVAQTCRRHNKFHPENRSPSTLGKHAPHRGCESASDALAHTGLLGCVGACILERHPHLTTPVLGLPTDTVASSVSPQPVGADTAGNRHRLYESLK